MPETTHFDAAADNGEGWGAYRKLIVETLHRLDEYISEIKNEQDHMRLRIQGLESKTTDARLDKIETEMSSIKRAKVADDAQKGLLSKIGLGLWSVAVVVVTTIVNMSIHYVVWGPPTGH